MSDPSLPYNASASEDDASVGYDGGAFDDISLSSDDIEAASSVAPSVLSTTAVIGIDEEVGEEIKTEKDATKASSACNTETESESTVTHEHCAEYFKCRLDNFHQARHLRQQNGKYRSCGIIGLFDHLTGVRIDLKWAENAAFCQMKNLPYPTWSDYHRREQFQKTPIFTYTMIGIITATMICSFYLNGWKIAPLRENPMCGPTAQVLLDMGAMQTSRMIVHGEWYRLVTAIFLHAGLFHFVINTLALFFLGSLLEKVHGPVTITGLYMVAALGGNVASAVFSNPNTISLGASGGIFSLLGICAADCWNHWDLIVYDNKIYRFPFLSCLTVIFIECVVNFSLGLTVFVDNFCHVGGFVYGICLGIPLLEHLSLGPKTRRRRGCSIFWKMFAAGLALTLLLTTSALLFTSDPEVGQPPDICPWCHYISCVPTRWWECDECATVSATIHYKENVLELLCPGGIPTMVSLPHTDYDILKNSLPDYCRNYCP